MGLELPENHADSDCRMSSGSPKMGSSLRGCGLLVGDLVFVKETRVRREGDSPNKSMS